MDIYGDGMLNCAPYPYCGLSHVSGRHAMYLSTLLRAGALRRRGFRGRSAPCKKGGPGPRNKKSHLLVAFVFRGPSWA